MPRPDVRCKWLSARLAYTGACIPTSVGCSAHVEIVMVSSDTNTSRHSCPVRVDEFMPTAGRKRI